MPTSRHEGDLYVNGALAARTVSFGAGVISAANIAAAAGIEATKVEHQHRQRYSQPNTAATTETRVIHHVYGAAATVINFSAGSIAAAIGNSTVTIDLKKNGTTVLTGVITLDNANTARVVEAGTIATAGAVAGDVYEIVITATVGSGTLPTGVFASLTINESPQ